MLLSGSDKAVQRTTEIHDAYLASANPVEREIANSAQSAGTTMEALRRKKETGVTEKRVIYPPGGLTHVSIKDPAVDPSSSFRTFGTIETDMRYAASSPARRASLATMPAGVRLIGNPVCGPGPINSLCCMGLMTRLLAQH